MILEDVFNYIHENALCDIHKIAEALNEDEKKIAAAVEELQIRNFIQLHIKPLKEADETDKSCFYEAVADKFKDNAEYCHCKDAYGVTSIPFSDWACWDVCTLCGKRIEDGYHNYNHHDGEDDDDVDIW